MDLRFTAVYVVLGLIILAVELIGVSRKEAGDTITEHWRYADEWLRTNSPWARWFFRIFTAGLFAWVSVHFLVGAD